MLNVTAKLIEEFQGMSKEEQVKFANETSVENLEILNEHGFSFVAEDGKISDVLEDVTFEERDGVKIS